MGHFWQYQLFGYTVHMNTLIMVWAAMLVLLGLTLWLTASLQVIPGKKQVFAEKVYDFCRSITLSTAGKRGDSFLFYVGALFLLILTCNLMGQLPLRLIQLPEGELIAATGDINVPAALAIATLLMYFFFGIKAKGLGYFKHYLSPLPTLIKGQPFLAQIVFILCFWPFIFINILEDVTRPGSLTIRLFFNIFVGEILAIVATALIPQLQGVGLGMFVIFLELFVAVVQAYIFAMLSSVYISLMSDDHDDHEHTPAITPA